MDTEKVKTISRGRHALNMALQKQDDETKHVTFCTDNCTAQNKNWVLFTACIILVNEDWSPESITFEYFQPGHSFMKPDSIHGQIGKKWKRTSEVLDYGDLKRFTKSSNKLNTIISLRARNFKLFTSGCTQRNKSSSIPKLKDRKCVQFRKGSRKMFFKQELEDDEFSEASILKPKFILELPETVRSDRGINTKKEDIIVRDLLPHMTPRKRIFWMNLPSFDDL
ncbi:unnamed protein product [Phaedon cochleariae]|uniref:Uncharacterized protein n=1 Tax=Phaedon cochleariae TaxID=80249 RepID=A0A9N9SJB8_PHACE|nr:unnamed protein product [Phaedon cochleariae]